jgi:hypothetical protein
MQERQVQITGWMGHDATSGGIKTPICEFLFNNSVEQNKYAKITYLFGPK